MSEARQAFDAAIRAWNEGDLNRYLDLYAENIALHGYSGTPMGKGEVRGFYEGIFAALSDLSLEIHEVVEDGSQLGCRFTLHGTQTGEMAGIAPTGRRIAQPGLTIMRFEGKKVAERYSVADFGALIAQLIAE